MSAPELMLTAEEVTELTERVLEHGARARFTPQVPLERCIELLEAQAVPREVIRAAVADLRKSRDERLSSVLRRKTDELERMLFAVLPRLDAPFAATAARGAVRYRIAAARGRLEIQAGEHSAFSTRSLFTLIAEGPRPAPWWRRLLGLRASMPRRVVVVDPLGASLAELIARALDRRGGDAAMAAALESLRGVLLSEVDRAVGFLTDLDFRAGLEAGPGGGT